MIIQILNLINNYVNNVRYFLSFKDLNTKNSPLTFKKLGYFVLDRLVNYNKLENNKNYVYYSI